MNYPGNLALQISFIIVPVVAYSVASKSVFGRLRRAVLAIVLAFLGAFAAWYVSGYQAPHPFLTMQRGPMNPDLVFIGTFFGLLAAMALVAFIFGGNPNKERAQPEVRAHAHL